MMATLARVVAATKDQDAMFANVKKLHLSDERRESFSDKAISFLEVKFMLVRKVQTQA